MPLLTLSTSAQQIVPQNYMRKSMVFQNEDTTINIFIKKERPGSLTVSSTDHDHRLGPGDAVGLVFGQDGDEAIQERWTAIAASGTPNLSVFETEDRRR